MSQFIKKDYKNLELANPRKIKEAGQKKKQLLKAVGWVGVAGVILLVYWLFFSPQFKIQEINIGGINKISRDKFDKIVNDYRYSLKWLIFSRNNTLIFSEAGLKQRVGQSYLLENIEVEKDFPAYVEIWVEEKDSNIVWLTGSMCFNLDQDGMAIENCESAVRANIIRIKDDADNPVAVGKGTVSPATLAQMIKIQELLAGIVKPDIFYYHVDGPYSVRVTTEQNYEVYFNLEEGIELQVERLRLLLAQEEIQQKLPQIKYFDLRFGEKIYYQ
ncbi:TPA: hypothetical protein DF272_03535 [Candidatus Falkowbacteria bacterium]|nr:hypothetical protein [Candidatus Falkowbacteria bacterium]